jgi:hypothetical protein
MAPHRADSFVQALTDIRERLRDGVFRPGERIAATEVADLLGLSATPVREALSRLSGEGLLEDRRGQGFFVSALTGLDIADLYRLSLAHLSIAEESARQTLGGTPVSAIDRVSFVARDPVREVERVFADWILEAGGRSLWMSYRSLLIKLGPVRRIEPLLFDDLAAEAVGIRALCELTPDRRFSMLRIFHDRRIAHADRMAPLLDRDRQNREV